MTPKVTVKPYAEYIGRGEFQVGIPARDLTREEWDALDKTTRGRIEDSGLYRFNDAGDDTRVESTEKQEG